MVGSALFTLSETGYAASGKTILSGLCLSVQAGRIYGLVGQNGSGKSTLLKILARHLPATHGQVHFAGQDLAAWSDRAFARQVAYMPQFPPAADGMTVRELVALGRFPWHGTLGRFSRQDQAMVEMAITQTGLQALADQPVDSLSGGERQRVWLALMLAQNAQCLLLDEPTSALDIAHEADMLALLRRLNRSNGLAVVVILHDINLAARFCDDIIALRGGQMIAHGPAHEIVVPEMLTRIYGVPMGVFSHPVSGEPVSYLL